MNIGNAGTAIESTSSQARTAYSPPASRSQSKAAGEDDVRRKAYLKWEAAGKPCGDGVNFWLDAEKELRTTHPSAR